MAEWSSCDRNCGLQNLKYVLLNPLQKMFASFWSLEPCRPSLRQEDTDYALSSLAYEVANTPQPESSAYYSVSGMISQDDTGAACP